MTMSQPMNEFEQCISEWADRCRERDVEITKLREALAQAEQRVEQLELTYTPETGAIVSKQALRLQQQLQASQQQVTRLRRALQDGQLLVGMMARLPIETERIKQWDRQAQAALAPEAGTP